MRSRVCLLDASRYPRLQIDNGTIMLKIKIEVPIDRLVDDRVRQVSGVAAGRKVHFLLFSQRKVKVLDTELTITEMCKCDIFHSVYVHCSCTYRRRQCAQRV